MSGPDSLVYSDLKSLSDAKSLLLRTHNMLRRCEEFCEQRGLNYGSLRVAIARRNRAKRQCVDSVSVHGFGYWEDRWPEGYYERLEAPAIGRNRMKLVGRRGSTSATLQVLHSGNVKVFPHASAGENG